MARMRKNEKNGPGLLFILVTLVVVAVVGARFFGFYPNGDEPEKPEQIKLEEPKAPPGPVVDTTPKVLVFHSHTSENYKPKDSHERGAGVGDIVQVGEAFVRQLQSLGVTAIHDKNIHDKPRYSDAFINSEKKVNELLAGNSQIR